MVHFHYNSKEHLTIRITNDFSHLDTERIALFLEGTYANSFVRELTLQVESDLPRPQMNLLQRFCEQLPYKSHIALKYPILEWVAYLQ